MKKTRYLSAAITVLVFITTVLLILLARGYSIDFGARSIERRGILRVETIPEGATAELDGGLSSNTPKVFSSLEPGELRLKITKDGYHTWEKNVEVYEEMVTYVQALLLPVDPSYQRLVDTEIENAVFTEKSNRVFYTVDTAKSTQIWTKSLDFSPLNFQKQEVQVLSLSKEVFGSDFDLLPSPSGQNLLITQTVEGKKAFYLVPGNGTSKNITELQILNDLQPKTVSWSNDELHLLVESQDETISYDIETKQRFLIQKKDDTGTLVFGLTPKNQVLYPQPISEEVRTEEDDGTKTYASYLKSIDIDGKNDKVVINDPRYDEIIKNLTGIHPHPEGKLMVLESMGKLFISDIEKATIKEIEVDESEFIGYSPDGLNFIYDNKAKSSIYSYIIKVEEGDEESKVGQYFALDYSGIEYQSLIWHVESTGFAGFFGGQLKFAEFQGASFENVLPEDTLIIPDPNGISFDKEGKRIIIVATERSPEDQSGISQSSEKYLYEINLRD